MFLSNAHKRMTTHFHLDRVTVSLTFFSIMAGLAVPYCLMHAIDEGLHIRAFQPALLWSLCAAGAQIFASITGYVARLRAKRESAEIEKDVRQRLFLNAIHADFKAITEGDLIRWPAQLLHTAASYGEWVHAKYSLVLPMLISGVCTGFVLLSLSWQLALLSLILFPACLVFLVALRRQIQETTRRMMTTQEALYAELMEVFSSLVPLRALGKTKTAYARFSQTCAHNVASQLIHFAVIAKQGPILEIYQALVLIAVFGIGGFYVSKGLLSIGLIVGFQLYLTRLFGLMRNGAGVFTAYHQFVEGRRRAALIETLPQASQASFEACAPPVILEIAHLDFSFDDHVIWRDFSLVMYRGDRKSILRCSGSGKTTLARLILGLYRPDSGTIALCGQTPSCIGFVPQDNFILPGTLRENIEFLSGPLSDASYEACLDICRLRHIHERTQTLPSHALPHILSGGEQRRIMLARALAIQPVLLIIDQMTSDLEPDLCDAIFHDLDIRFPDLAILYLGHRPPFPDRTQAP